MSQRGRQSGRKTRAFAVALILVSVLAGKASAQTTPGPLTNSYLPFIDHWGNMPEGRIPGYMSAVSIDREGNIWVVDRCTPKDNCAGRSEAPIFQFDPSGRLLKNFGAGMFVFPHGIYVDKDDNVWVTDGDAKDGQGQQVIKFSSDGKVLLTLGKAGVAGDGPDTFNKPSAVVVAPNGDIFVADGHGGNSNARIVKFSKDGKFLMTWGKKGTAPGEFDTPHAIAMDAAGRVLVGDRGNKRIQIFDQNGKFLEQWMQFGAPTGIYIDKKGILYVGEWTVGIHIGRIEDGVVTEFIADHDVTDVAAEANGNLYTLYETRVKKFVRK